MTTFGKSLIFGIIILVLLVMAGMNFEKIKENKIFKSSGGEEKIIDGTMPVEPDNGIGDGAESLDDLLKKEKEEEMVIKFCDRKGNEYSSEEEARKAGLTDEEFGATLCPEYENEKELSNRLDLLNAKIIPGKNTESGLNELVYLGDIQPIKALNTVDREWFKNELVKDMSEVKKEVLMEKWKGLTDDDFKNTGELKNDIDFQILLNNILLRTKLEPKNGEQLESLIEDLKKIK